MSKTKCRLFACGVCGRRRVSERDSMCVSCASTFQSIVMMETRQMLHDVAGTVSFLLQGLQDGAQHFDSETSRLLTEPEEIVDAYIDDRLIVQPPMGVLLKQYPHLAHEV